MAEEILPTDFYDYLCYYLHSNGQTDFSKFYIYDNGDGPFIQYWNYDGVNQPTNDDLKALPYNLVTEFRTLRENLIHSANKIPCVSTEDRNLIINGESCLIYNTTTGTLELCTNGSWVSL
jgi:hypothetical protein